MKELGIDDDLTLAKLREGDINELAAVVAANLSHLGVWMPWAVKDYGVENAREFIERNLGNEDPKARTFGIFYEGKIAGCAGFVPQDEKGVAEIGYWISREHQGKGIITRCTRALADHAFSRSGCRPGRDTRRRPEFKEQGDTRTASVRSERAAQGGASAAQRHHR